MHVTELEWPSNGSAMAAPVRVSQALAVLSELVTTSLPSGEYAAALMGEECGITLSHPFDMAPRCLPLSSCNTFGNPAVCSVLMNANCSDPNATAEIYRCGVFCEIGR